MFSTAVLSAFSAINAALDTLAETDLSGWDAADLLQLAELTETSIRSR